MTIAAGMDSYGLFLIGAINLDFKGIEFDPHLGRGPVGRHTVTIAVHLYLAKTVELTGYFPATVKWMWG